MNTITNHPSRCAICLEATTGYEQDTVRLEKCKHIFHQSCINRWFDEKHCCLLDSKRVEHITTPEVHPEEISMEEISSVPGTEHPPEIHTTFEYYIRSWARGKSIPRMNSRGFEIEEKACHRMNSRLILDLLTIGTSY